MGQQAFTYEIQVRWGDSDRLGHVNNTRFMEYMQEARIAFLTTELRAAGAQPGAMVVRKMDVEFLRPVTDASGPLTIDVSVLHVAIRRTRSGTSLRAATASTARRATPCWWRST